MIFGGVFLFCTILNCIYMISYISSTSSFAKPLSKEEESEYLRLYKEGDCEAKNIIIERNLRLVAHIVKKYSKPNQDADDLISIGTIGLIKAINSFDIDKGTRLATYASKCIENEILMNIRYKRKERNEVYLQDPIGFDKEGNELTLLDLLDCDEEDIIDKVDLKIEIVKLYNDIRNLLKKRERDVIEMRYGLNNKKEKTQNEIAEMLGISRSYVSRIEKKAINKLGINFGDK